MKYHTNRPEAWLPVGAVALLALDGAGWHRTGGGLQAPDNIRRLPRPSTGAAFRRSATTDASSSRISTISQAGIRQNI